MNSYYAPTLADFSVGSTGRTMCGTSFGITNVYCNSPHVIFRIRTVARPKSTANARGRLSIAFLVAFAPELHAKRLSEKLGNGKRILRNDYHLSAVTARTFFDSSDWRWKRKESWRQI